MRNLAKDEDYVGQFIDDCLTGWADNPDCRMSCTRMYDAFRWWWAQNMDVQERRTPGIKSITTQLRDRGSRVEKVGGKVYLYQYYINDNIAEEVKEWSKKRTSA